MKRLVICADGTWNVRDQLDETTGKRRPTNVTKVARAIRTQATANDVPQIVIYHDGVGTSGGMDKFTGGAFGSGIEENVRELYRSILYNYVPGDELFLFGFSRGAFTVRTLVGFMNAVGLIAKDDDYWLPEIYGCYEKGKKSGSPEWTQAFHHMEGVRGPCPPIKFIGVWDTVGALGAPGVIGQLFNKGKYEYHDVGLNDHVQNAYHALAIDERRTPFQPAIWKRPAGWTGTLQQAWFVGVHSDVGGGYPRGGLANEALHWMVEKAQSHGLEFNNAYLTYYLPCFNADKHDSMDFKYRLLGEYVRPIGGFRGDGEMVHQSASDRMGYAPSVYRPPNLEKGLSAPGGMTTCTTTRIARGTPCP